MRSIKYASPHVKADRVYLVCYGRDVTDYSERRISYKTQRGYFLVRAAAGAGEEIRRRASAFLQIPEINIQVL